jgi:hypothetical protein
MKLSGVTIFFINLSVILGGVLFVFFSSAIGANVWGKLFEALGIGLIATGGVNILARWLEEKPTLVGIKMIANTRNMVDARIHERKFSADKIEATGITLANFLQELSNNSKVVDRILNDNVRLRLAFVHPESPFLIQKFIEDNTTSAEGQKASLKKQIISVENCILFYKLLCARYQSALKGSAHPGSRGVIQIKLLQFCPHITIERYDKDIYWGLYTADAAGEYAPMFLTSLDDNYVLYDKLKKHFNSLFAKDFSGVGAQSNVLISMESSEPVLNHELAEKILGKERLDSLLGDAPSK